MRRLLTAAAFALALVAVAPAPAPAGTPIALTVDLRDAASRALIHAHETIPAAPGAFTIVYPKWIPGEHGPTGPIGSVAGLVIRANGTVLPWRRDQVDGYAFSVVVPAGATAIDCDFDFILGRAGFASGGNGSTPNLAVLNWNQTVFAPQGYRSHDLLVSPHMLLPSTWQFGTALPHPQRNGEMIDFATVSLERLVDSPVSAGVHFRRIPIYAHDGATAEVDAVADSQSALAFTPKTIGDFRDLLQETQALYGGRHWQHYHFLLTLSNNVGSFGLEHHESSDDRVGERTFLDPDAILNSASLLPHEFTHSWNGKFRRPAGLATPDFQQPMRGDLLWVYEGLTTYYGEVLSFRMGTRDAATWPDFVAHLDDQLDATSGRHWRPLGDTAVSAQLLYDAPGYGANERRGTDFYDEGLLLWLDADTLIRQRSHGTRSLDDFARRFLGMQTAPPSVLPYTRADVIAALDAVEPYDWASFLHDRLDAIAPHPPAGYERAGYRLTYSSTPNFWDALHARTRTSTDLSNSLGIVAGADGTVNDVAGDSPAQRAGIGPGMKIVAIGGRVWSRLAATDTLTQAARDGRPFEIITDDLGTFATRTVLYTGGVRYAHLMRVAGTPDLLAAIVRPRRAGTK